MKNQGKQKSILDYKSFTRDLRGQLNAVSAMERQFFEIDELCEWSVRNEVTCLNDSGKRVSIVDDCLGRQQEEIYKRLRKAVRDLDRLLAEGEECFIMRED